MINPNSTSRSSHTGVPTYHYSYAVKAETGDCLAAPDIVFNPETIVIMFGKPENRKGHFWATTLVARTQEEMNALKEDFEEKRGVIWKLEQGD